MCPERGPLPSPHLQHPGHGEGSGHPPPRCPSFLGSLGFFRAFGPSHKGNIKITLDRHFEKVMKPPINQQIIQGRHFMPCFLYSHSEWNIKVTGGSQFLPLSGPISESTAGCICHQTSCLCASTGRDRLGQPLGFHYQEKVNIFRVL